MERNVTPSIFYLVFKDTLQVSLQVSLQRYFTSIFKAQLIII